MNTKTKSSKAKSEERPSSPETGKFPQVEKPQKSAGGGLPEGPSMWWRHWPLMLLALALLFPLLQGDFGQAPRISYSRFKKELSSGNVDTLTAKGNKLRGTFKKAIRHVPLEAQGAKAKDQQRLAEDKQKDGEKPTTDKQKDEEPKRQAEKTKEFRTVRPPFADEKLMEQITRHEVDFTSKGEEDTSFWMILLNLLPLLLLLGLFLLMMRGMSQQAGGMMSIGQSKARRIDKERSDTTFEDVAGVEEPKRRLEEVVDFLTDPKRFSQLGCRVPKGVLLMGPPGTGKTLLARAVAGEAEVPFFSITGSDFMEMFVGVGASRVRDLFKRAKEESPCIIFVDELDSIGRSRGAGLGGGHDEREQTLNQLLSEIDGFEPNESIVVIGATNRPDTLDPALMRPGRFDRQIVIDLPVQKERYEILKVHTAGVPLDDDVDLQQVARSMPGHSGADLGNLVNEAALLAARREHPKVTAEDFSEARDQVLMGQRRGSLTLSDDERHTVALHESGHALVAYFSPSADPVEKVSIIPRGRALGGTQQLPEERFNRTVDALKARLRVMLGGRAAEEVVVGTISTGAADDLQNAGRLARQMVSRWGMSENFRSLAFEQRDSQVFLGEQIAQQKEYSEQTARELDLEIKKLVDQCYEEALKLLKENREQLQALADKLEEEETLEGESLKEILENTSNATPKEEA
ncbi:MAG: ATP-dependent zinc metalloprotease FtsH [Verrucomicrobiota bacterium]